MNIVSGGMTRPLAFSTDFFDFQPDYFPYPDGRAPEGLATDHGFSGIRFRHPINRPGVWDEALVFQGASYFRAVARDTLLRPVRARARHRHGGTGAGGVPALHRVLGRGTEPRTRAR